MRLQSFQSSRLYSSRILRFSAPDPLYYFVSYRSRQSFCVYEMHVAAAKADPRREGPEDLGRDNNYCLWSSPS